MVWKRVPGWTKEVNWYPQLMTVPEVGLLVCAALPGQKDSVVTANAINIPSFVSFDLLTTSGHCQIQSGPGKRRPGLHQALHPLPTRNEWGGPRRGETNKNAPPLPTLSSIRWRRGRNPGA